MTKLKLENKDLKDGTFYLEDIPASTKELILDDCTELTHLPSGQYLINSISLRNCNKVKNLPRSLAVADKINLEGCSSIDDTKDNVEFLEKREEGRYDKKDNPNPVIWPKHFERTRLVDKAKSRLSQATQKYKENQPAGAPNTQELVEYIIRGTMHTRGGGTAQWWKA